MHMISRPTPQKLCMTSLLLALISRQTQVNNSNQTKYTKSGTKVKMEPNTCQEVKYYCRNRLQVVLHSSYDCHLHAVCLVYVEQGRRRRQERACAITIIVFWPSQSYNHSSRSYNIMYVLKAQEKEGTRAWLSSSLVFAHGGRNLRHLGSWYFLLYYVLLHTLQLGTHKTYLDPSSYHWRCPKDGSHRAILARPALLLIKRI